MYLKPHSQLKYFRPRSITYAFRDKVEKELERLKAECYHWTGGGAD